MDWQAVAVAVVVAAAVLFLAARFLLPRRPRKGTQTFIPLSTLKKPRPPDRECH